MPRELAQLLVDEGVVDPDGVGRAFARQREAGGALDTALLELGLVAEDRLTALLARAADLPPAPPSAYEVVDARARRVFPSKVAERHGLAPFALDGGELSLVATLPIDLGLLDEISFMLSLQLSPHVGPEWRVRALIQRLYGGPLPQRLARLAGAAGQPARPEAAGPPALPAPAPSPEAAEPGPAEPPPTPAGRPLPPRPAGYTGFGRAGDEPLEPLAAALAQAAEAFELDWEAEALAAPLPVAGRSVAGTPAPGPGSPPSPSAGVAPPAATPPPVAPPDRSAPPRWTVAAARAALAGASRRDEVVLAALRYARDFFQYAALFAVTRDAVAGHDALGPEEGARDVVRTVALYVTDPGFFRTTLDTLAPYLGPVSRDAAGSAMVLEGLGRGSPRTTLVYPILLRGRPVCILYADNGQAPVSARRLGDLLLFLSQVGGAFERIIRARKGEPAQAVRAAPAIEPAVEPPFEPPPPPAPEVASAPILVAAAVESSPALVAAEVAWVEQERAEEELVLSEPTQLPPEPAPVEPAPVEPARPESAPVDPAPAPAPPAPAPAPAPDLSDVEEAFFSSAPGALPQAGPAAQEPPPPAAPEIPSEIPPEVAEAYPELPSLAPPAPAAAPPPPPPPPPPASLEVTAEHPLHPAQLEVLQDPSALVGAYLVSPRGSDERAHLLGRLVERADEVGPLLCEQLPGPLDVPPEALAATAPPDQGPVFAAVAALGPAALRPLLAMLAEPAPERRRAAVALLGQLGEGASLPPLAERCFDQAPAVAQAARVALALHRRDPAMKPVPEKLRRALLSGLADKAGAAARAIAALRDAESIPLLIQALEGSDAATAAAAADALAAITLQRHGTRARDWLMWWKQNRGRSRSDWLFGALTSGDRELRLSAANELREAAATPVAYSADLPEGERQAAAQAWQRWFTKGGHRP